MILKTNCLRKDSDRKGKIMVCAASNRALDEVLIRFVNSPDFKAGKRKLVRLGFCDDYSDPLVSKYTLESQSLDILVENRKKKATDNYMYTNIGANIEK